MSLIDTGAKWYIATINLINIICPIILFGVSIKTICSLVNDFRKNKPIKTSFVEVNCECLNVQDLNELLNV